MATHHRINALRRQFQADAWATERLRSALAAVPLPTEAQRLWGHLLASQRRWLARLDGTDATLREGLWESVEQPAGSEATLAALHQRWQAFLAGLSDAELGRVVTFHSTRGEPQADALGDILHHVLLHHAYHRGQLALLLRQDGHAPPLTDFIVYARSEQAPPRDSRKLFTPAPGEGRAGPS